MRKFSSYGPIDTKLHYYVPRQALVDQAVTDLVGDVPSEGGLQLMTITVVVFVEAVDDENRTRYETPYQDAATGALMEPVLVTTVA